MPLQVIWVVTDLRQDLLRSDRLRDVPWRVEQNSVDGGAELRALIGLAILADNDPRRENRPIGAVQHQPGVGSVDPDAFRRQPPRQPALAFKVYLDLAQAVRRGLVAVRGARAIALQGLAQGPVGRRRRRQRL